MREDSEYQYTGEAITMSVAARGGLEEQREVALGPRGVPRAVPQVVEVGERMLGERDPLLLDVGGQLRGGSRG